MPVTIPIASRPAEPFTATHAKFRHDPSSLLARTSTTYVPERILQSSVDGSQNIIAQRNGFVHGVLLAYNMHHNLVVRPDDVWMAILSQLNFYINAHAEELRDKFVAHAERKELQVISESPWMDRMDFGELALQMSDAIGGMVKDSTLVPWVLPNFTTTTPDDSAICSILLMSTFKAYFDYHMMTRCGIPFVTLLRTKSDWESILSRIERLESGDFGKEPMEWAGMLRAILLRFVRAFDFGEGEASKDLDFWQRMVHEEHASGTYWIGGWMSAFCAWDIKGRFFADSSGDTHGSLWDGPRPDWLQCLEIDGHRFPRVQACPDGYAEVDVHVSDGDENKLDCRMLAGHVGVTIEGERLDTVRMAPQWFMYVKGKANETSRWPYFM